MADESNIATDISPEVEAPPTVETEATPQETASEVLETLKKLNVETPQQVENLATASAQAGHLANQLGEERRQRQELEQMVSQLQQQATVPNQPSQDTTDYYSDNTPGNLTQSQIESAVTKAVNQIQYNNNRAQQEVNAKWVADENRVASDQEYSVVKEVWDNVKDTPAVRQRLMAGQTTLWDEYSNVKMSWFRTLTQKSQTALEQVLKAGGKAIPTPPHMESGDSDSVPRLNDDDDMKQLRRKITDPSKGYTGSTEELDALVRTFIPGS